MPKKAILPAVILVVLLGAAAYRLFSPSTTAFPAGAPINSYLKGEMAKLSLPEAPKGLTDHIIMREDGSPIKLSTMKGKAIADDDAFKAEWLKVRAAALAKAGLDPGWK